VVPETVKLEGGDGDREIEREEEGNEQPPLKSPFCISSLFCISLCLYFIGFSKEGS
jgi:hypothetical protein